MAISRGIKGSVPSIRLQLIREAMEDYEYMTLAAKRGHKAETDKIVAGLARSFTDWDHQPYDYMVARAKIADLICGKQ